MAAVKKVCVVRNKAGNIVVLYPGDTVPEGVSITNPDVIDVVATQTRKKKDTSK